jgi:hypothetical protein
MAVLQIWLEKYFARPFAEETVFVSLRKRRHGFPSHRNRARPLSPASLRFPRLNNQLASNLGNFSGGIKVAFPALVNPFFFAEVFHEPGKNMQ